MAAGVTDSELTVVDMRYLRTARRADGAEPERDASARTTPTHPRYAHDRPGETYSAA